MIKKNCIYKYRVQKLDVEYDWYYSAYEIINKIDNIDYSFEYILDTTTEEKAYNNFIEWIFKQEKDTKIYYNPFHIISVWRLIKETEGEQKTIAVAARELKPNGKLQDFEIFWFI
jgi:hypothetical protein